MFKIKLKMSTIKFFKSQRGGEIINKDNYLYNKDRKINETTTRWRCRKRTCPGSIILNEELEVIDSLEHNHHPEDESVVAKL